MQSLGKADSEWPCFSLATIERIEAAAMFTRPPEHPIISPAQQDKSWIKWIDTLWLSPTQSSNWFRNIKEICSTDSVGSMAEPRGQGLRREGAGVGHPVNTDRDEWLATGTW
jgi:hypothetical protein